MTMNTGRRQFLEAVAGVLCGAGAARAKAPLNIVLVLVDDLGWAELGCYGNRFNNTPNIDRLAREGVRFTDAYAAAPVCSPTRVSIMTGQYPARVGITDYLRADDEKFLSPDLKTVAKALHPAGYRSALIGKWHLMGDYATRKGDPKLHGFDEVICSETKYIGGGSYFYPYAFMPEVKARHDGEYLTDRLNQEAVDFITRNRKGPFFVYLSHYSVHTRLAAKPALVDKYARLPGAGKNRNNPELAAMLESIDDGVGMIAATLDKLGIAGNTALVFTSDNGGETRVTSNAPLRGGKSELYEGGIRVPLIVSAPGFGKTGSTCHVPVTTIDFYPTFLDFAGLKPDPGQTLDGVSLSRAVKGERSLAQRPLYWHYPLDKPHFLGGRSAGAIRQGDFKLIQFFDTNKVELYNLKEDIGETKDVSAKFPGMTERLRARLRAWRDSVGASISSK
jgi:arylsulfatase A